MRALPAKLLQDLGIIDLQISQTQMRDLHRLILLEDKAK